MRRLLRTIRQFLSELRRRNVYQVAVTYVVVGFFVIEGADLTLTRLGLPPWTVTFVVVLVGLGFPIALVMASALEVTPEGVRVEETVAEETEGSEEVPTPASTTRDLWIGSSVLVLLLLGAWWVWSGPGDGTDVDAPQSNRTEVEEPSVAVLPFESLNPAQESKTIAQGIHGDLITRLSNVGDLLVKSGESVERYRETQLSLPAIADTLGVRWVVSGEIQQAGGKIQVRAQLIDPAADANVWADAYRRTLSTENLFAIQGDITQKIVNGLQAELTADEQDRITGAPTKDLKAYRLYVRGRNLLASRRPDSIKRAQRHFEQALARDSTYALAWAGLADAHILYNLYSRRTAPEKSKSALEKAHAAATQARDLDPSLAEAWSAIGAVHMQEYARGLDQGDGPAALKALLRAVELKPSYAQAQQWLGELYYLLGRPQRGLEHASLAVELNPEHVGARRVLIFARLANDRAQEAWPHVQRLPPALRGGFEAFVLYDLGRWEKLERMARKALRSNIEPARLASRAILARIAALRGDTSRARTHLAEVARQDGAFAYFSEGVIHAALGEPDSAFSAWQRIEEWAGPAPGTALRYGYSDILTPLRDDPRYQKLIRDLNVSWGLNPDGSLPEDIDVPTSLTDR